MGGNVLTKLAAVLAVAGAAMSAPACAQSYPSKPIRIIIPTPPGALTDIVSRRIGAAASAVMGQSLVMENRPGANFVIPAEACRRAAPDGYTFCVLSTSALTFNPHLIDNLPYDPAKDLRGVINLGIFIGGLVVSPKLDVKTVADLRAAMQARPDAFNFGTYGPSTSSNVFRLFMSERLGVKATEVPYKGANELVAALISGELQMTWTALGNWADNPGDAKGRILAQDALKRSAKLPGVPTYAEAGLGEYPIRTWMALFAPAGVPDAIIEQVNRQFAEAINKPEISEFLVNQIIEPAVSSAKDFDAYVAREREETGKLLRKYNIPKIN